MKIITRKEFRDNLKHYLDLASREQVIVHGGKDKKPVLLSPVEREEEIEMCFSNPDFKARLEESVAQALEGKVTIIEAKEELTKLFGL